MASTFVGITRAELEQFLTRAYRALRPHRSEVRGELVYDLNLSKHVVVRIYSSIGARAEEGAGHGEDAIRVIMFSKTTNRPLKKGKAPIVKRTTNWRDNLKARIGDAAEEYEDRESYWEYLASGQRDQDKAKPAEAPPAPPASEPPPPTQPSSSTGRIPTKLPPPTDAQMGYLGKLMRAWQARGRPWRDLGDYLIMGPPSGKVYERLDSAPTREEVEAGGKMAASALIDALQKALGWGRRAGEVASEDPLDLYDQATRA